MSKVNCRPNRSQRQALQEKKRALEKELRERNRAAGLEPISAPSILNATSAYNTIEEEQEGRQSALLGHMEVLRAQLPRLLNSLGKIQDIRDPKKIKHKLTMLLLYGLLMFVFQVATRRQANREMTEPAFKESLRLLFPELDELPHADTLYRVLCHIDIRGLEQAHIELVQDLIRKKKFRRYLINNCYPIAMDGSQKWKLDTLWADEALERDVGGGEDKSTQYYIYVLEASLAFQNGMTIPLITEFLSYTEGDTAHNKQDCEQRAFHRLAARIKRFFKRYPIIVLLDGLYANGPIMELCEKYNWQFMIVLQDKSLPTVWEEVRGLRPLQPNNKLSRDWGNRRQNFWWVNDIEYCYGSNGRRRLTVHVVVCEESWEEVSKEAQIVPKSSRHVWLSSRPLNPNNVHSRCNLGARHRWGIEAGFLVEKHQGYQYEHRFAYRWNAMRGYHCLMRMAHLFNILSRYSRNLANLYRRHGVRGFIRFIFATCTGQWLDSERVRQWLSSPFQLRLE